MPKHHEELTDIPNNSALSEFSVRKIALVYDVDHHPANKVIRIACERVFERGDNHQSLRPDPKDQMRHELVIKRFQSEFVPPEPGSFDHIVKLSVVEDQRTNLQTTVNALFPILGKEMPSSDQLDQALEDALMYKTTLRKKLQGVETRPPRYYALAVEVDLEEAARAALQSLDKDSKERKEGEEFVDFLVAHGRLTGKPHITIVHETEVALEKTSIESEAPPKVNEDRAAQGSSKDQLPALGPQGKVWESCVRLGELSVQAKFSFELTGLAWNGRVMTFIVEHVRPHIEIRPQGSEEAVRHIEETLCKSLAQVLHVTVGTRRDSIRPFEAKGLVKDWRNGKKKELTFVKVDNISSIGRVVGLS